MSRIQLKVTNMLTVKSAREWIVVGALLSAAMLAGCAPLGSAAPSAAPVTEAPDPGGLSEPSQPAEATVHAFPRIGSCDQIAAAAPDYVAGMPLDQEDSYIEQDVISCVWKPAEGDISALADIQIFSVTITADTSDVPDPAVAEQYGIKGYFTDPRLDALGGVGLWLGAESAPVDGGSGTVIVPGVHVQIGGGHWGQDSQLGKDNMVTLALQLLNM